MKLHSFVSLLICFVRVLHYGKYVKELTRTVDLLA